MKKVMMKGFVASVVLGTALLTPTVLGAVTGTHTLRGAIDATSVHMFNKTDGSEFGNFVVSSHVLGTYVLDFTASGDQVAVALVGGFLFGQFTISPSDHSFRGVVTGGSGPFNGATGSIVGQVTSATRGTVTISYS